MSFNPLKHPIVFSIPRRLTPLSFWHEHMPFAMFLVDLLRPEVIVRLGTQYGDSYCAFCHSVHELNLSTRCYAIDNWQGDPHVGSYGSEVLEDLRAEHDPLYGSFSRLIQSTFDDALQHFADGSVDLLHIDGYHTYEVVKHDFESWLPKMSQHGVVLFHDTNVRERDFGVWKLWEELQHQYPHFEFLHGSGLGMLEVGKDFPRTFQEFLEASLEDAAGIRRFFSQLGQRLALEVQQRRHHQVLAERLAQQAAQLQGTVQGQQQALGAKEHQLAQLAAERERLAQQAAQLQGTVQGQQQALGAKEHQLAQLTAERERLAHEATQFQATIQAQQRMVAEKEKEVSSLKELTKQKAAQFQATIQAQQRMVAEKEKETSNLRRKNWPRN